VHEWLRTSEVPVLAIWGRNDEIFAAAGATAFTRDAANARIELIDGGHFLLESDLDRVADTIKTWLGDSITDAQ
jgi:pimeloyl-ACP methyl ester carboxylesterase